MCDKANFRKSALCDVTITVNTLCFEGIEVRFTLSASRDFEGETKRNFSQKLKTCCFLQEVVNMGLTVLTNNSLHIKRNLSVCYKATKVNEVHILLVTWGNAI